MDQHTKPDNPDAIEFSNAIRLTGRQWSAVGLFALLLFFFAPRLWKLAEPFTLEPDYRIPHDLGNDYWLYERHAELAAEQYDTLLIGDSVIWGEYATPQETLSHYLNERAGHEQYANLGLDGAHPLALSGLVEHYAGGVQGKNVVLECNLLWLSSPELDLQDATKTNNFNHPELVPQFVPHIPAYKKEISPRLGVVVEQHTPLSLWTKHLQQAYYNQSDLPTWTLEHPYDNPLKPLTQRVNLADHSRPKKPIAWEESDARMLEYPGVDPNTSLQWHAFQDTIRILQKRGNRVFVVVGPFNEHILSPKQKQLRLFGLAGCILANEDLYNIDSKRRYHALLTTVTARLDAQKIPYLAPGPLPTELYGDASHPLPAGYEMLARLLMEEPFFQNRK